MRTFIASIPYVCAGLLVATALQAQTPSAPRTVSDLIEQLGRAKPDPERAARARTAADLPAPATQDRIVLARFHLERGRAAAAIGRAGQHLEDLRLAAGYAANGHDDQLNILNELSSAEVSSGQMANFYAIRERLQGLTLHPSWRIIIQGSLAYHDALLGDMKSASARMAQADAAFQDGMRLPATHQWWRNLYVANLEGWRCRYLAAQGKLIQAEAACRVSLGARIEDNRINPERLTRRFATPSQTFLESVRNTGEVFLARLLLDQDRYAESEIALRSVLERVLEQSGRDSAEAVSVLSSLAANLYAQGRYAEAERIGTVCLETGARAGVVPEAFNLSNARWVIARSLASRGRWSEAITAFERRQEAIDRDPGQRGVLGRGDLMWALSLVRTGKAGEARRLIEPDIERLRRRLGDEHRSVAEARGFLGMALAAAGERESALAQFRAASRILLQPASVSDEQGSAVARADRLRLILDSYVGLLYDLRTTLPDAAEEAFALADVARGQTVQRAVNASAARFAAGDNALSQLVRREQDYRNEVRSLYEFLLRMLAAPPEQQLPKVVADMRKRIDEIERERKNLFGEIEKRFPAYANLISPRPATVAQVRAALRPGETMISLLGGAERTYVWAIPKSGELSFSAARLGDGEIQSIVAGLRKSLDPGNSALDQLPEFDLAAAHRLYSSLLAPGESAWRKADTLLIASSGALGQLPLSLLPVSPPPPARDQEAVYDRYRGVAWLARTHAIAQIPSANALITLRALPAGSAQRLPFIGFGDPVFDANQSTAPAAPATATLPPLRNLSITRVDLESAAEQQVAWTPYSRLAPLPDTRQELLAIAGALKADPQKDVVLGAAATPDSVRKADLGNRRIVAFATHGLLAGDLPGLTQPALAMAAPAGADVDKNPNLALLRMEDILGLKMNADWVVLSACNTAGADGQGAEAVSGLGRAFFYAGSRALLVTHWPVETTSARRLVTDTFERYAGRNDLSRAQALRQAMLELLDKRMEGGARPVSYAHPLFWAPYALVGDAAR